MRGRKATISSEDKIAVNFLIVEEFPTAYLLKCRHCNEERTIEKDTVFFLTRAVTCVNDSCPSASISTPHVSLSQIPLTVQDMILYTVVAMKTPTVQFETLVVEAWTKFLPSLGLPGYETQYPDSNRIMMEVVKMCNAYKTLEKVGVKKYQLTAAGRNRYKAVHKHIDSKAFYTSAISGNAKTVAKNSRTSWSAALVSVTVEETGNGEEKAEDKAPR